MVIDAWAWAVSMLVPRVHESSTCRCPCPAPLQIRQQLLAHLRRLRLPIVSCNGDTDVLRKAIVQVRGAEHSLHHKHTRVGGY